MKLVLDSWILLAWLKKQEPGAAFMADLWEKAFRGEVRLMANIVNLGEVFYLTAKASNLETADNVLENLRARPLEILSVPDALAWEAARVKARFPVSYADAFAAATAARSDCPLVTGDPEMRRIEAAGLVDLEWAGEPS